MSSFANARAAFEKATKTDTHQTRGRFAERSLNKPTLMSKKSHWGKVMQAVKTEGGLNVFKQATDKSTFAHSSKQINKHTYSEEEKRAFSEHMNLFFGNGDGGFDAELAHLLPIDPESHDLFTKVKDGKLLCKLINAAVEDTVDERALNKAPKNPWQFTENLNIVVEAARAIGCSIVNIGAEDLLKGNEILVLGVVWQIVRMQLTSDITLANCPFLCRLLEDGEELADLMSLTPEQLLLRWFNYHLREAGTNRRVRNFGSDLKDGQAYSILLNQLQPALCEQTGVQEQITAFNSTTANNSVEELKRRAGNVISTGRRMGAKAFLRPADIVNGNTKLNLAFVAQIFNVCPGLKATEAEVHEMAGLIDDDEGDSREERSFRMWLNSLKLGEELDAEGRTVKAPIHINNLFIDACDGLIILHALDKVHRGCVQWKKVNTRRPISRFQAIENCNYAVTIATALRYSMVNIGGLDIQKGNKKLILGLVWQMMRCHLLQILASLLSSSPTTNLGGSLNHTHAVTRRGSLSSRNPNSIDEREIITWANRRVQLAGRASVIRDFKDKSLASGVFLLDLLQAIAPGSLNPALCHGLEPGKGVESMSEEEKKNNARYVVSVARKLGATVFCTWEDIVEVKPKMMTALIACLMLHDRKKQKSFKKQVKTLARKHSTEISVGAEETEDDTAATTNAQQEQQPHDEEGPATSEP